MHYGTHLVQGYSLRLTVDRHPNCHLERSRNPRRAETWRSLRGLAVRQGSLLTVFARPLNVSYFMFGFPLALIVSRFRSHSSRFFCPKLGQKKFDCVQALYFALRLMFTFCTPLINVCTARCLRGSYFGLTVRQGAVDLLQVMQNLHTNIRVPTLPLIVC